MTSTICTAFVLLNLHGLAGDKRPDSPQPFIVQFTDRKSLKAQPRWTIVLTVNGTFRDIKGRDIDNDGLKTILSDTESGEGNTPHYIRLYLNALQDTTAETLRNSIRRLKSLANPFVNTVIVILLDD